jgi:hypothetical protein
LIHQFHYWRNADDARFEKKHQPLQRESKEGEVILIGFYGTTLEVSFPAFVDGPFGPERLQRGLRGMSLMK